jgi:hypothetical protein
MKEFTASVFRVEVLSSSVSVNQVFLNFVHAMYLFGSLVKPTDLFPEKVYLNA